MAKHNEIQYVRYYAPGSEALKLDPQPERRKKAWTAPVPVEERKVITSSKDVYECFYPLMCDLPTEEFWVLLLNQASKVIDKVRISAGGLAATVVDVRCILREALLKRASSMALCHNHPSGSIRPSREDDLLTRQVSQAAECMNIRLVDHVILTDGAFYSYADEGRI